MLKGFNYPLTPKGKSTLNPPPPWYYSADFLNIEFWSDPTAVAAVLPRGLDPDPAAKGHGNALFYDWQFSGVNEEYLDPARYQYREFFLLVDAMFEGKPVTYCPYIFVDNDAAIARGWTQGYPKRFGQEQPKYKRTSGVHFGPVDVVKYAEAFGAAGFMVDAPDQIGLTLKKAFEIPGPVLIGIQVGYRDNHKLFEKVHEQLLN